MVATFSQKLVRDQGQSHANHLANIEHQKHTWGRPNPGTTGYDRMHEPDPHH